MRLNVRNGSASPRPLHGRGRCGKGAELVQVVGGKPRLHHPVAPYGSASHAPVYNLVAFSAVVRQRNGHHQSLAPGAAVAGRFIDVLGMQTKGTVVPVAPIGYRRHRRPTVLAGEAGVSAPDIGSILQQC